VSDPFLKRLEIGFRRLFIRGLRCLVQRQSLPLTGLEFNASKFLFIRQDRIGDVLVSTPLFRALKSKYPGAILDVVLSPHNHAALGQNPHIRRRWIYRKTPLGALRLIRWLRSERYDFAIDLMDNPSATSTAICLLAGARWNVGINKENAYSYDIVVPLLSRKEAHIVDRLGQLLIPFGIDPAKEKLVIEYETSEKSEVTVRDHWHRLGLEGKRVVGINISAGGEVRFWGAENFRRLLKFLERDFPTMPVLILHKPAHRHQAMDVTKGVKNAVLSPETTFDEFAAFVRRLTLLITPDTSVVHLAAAFGLPAVVLYVQSDPNLRIWEPYRTAHRALVTPVDDLSTISPDSVYDSTISLLSEVGLSTGDLEPQ